MSGWDCRHHHGLEWKRVGENGLTVQSTTVAFVLPHFLTCSRMLVLHVRLAILLGYSTNWWLCGLAYHLVTGCTLGVEAATMHTMGGACRLGQRGWII